MPRSEQELTDSLRDQMSVLNALLRECAEAGLFVQAEVSDTPALSGSNGERVVHFKAHVYRAVKPTPVERPPLPQKKK